MKREERDIEGLKVTSQQLPAMRGYKLMTKLGKLVEPIARAMSPDMVAAARAGKFDVMVPIMMAVFAELHESVAEQLALDILQCTSVIVPGAGKGGNPGNVSLNSTEAINIAFTGNLKAMMRTLMFALEVNYRDFFPESAPVPEETSSPSESTPT